MKPAPLHRLVSLTVSLALASSLIALGSAPASACQMRGRAFDYITPNTLHVVIKPFDARYAKGEKVKVTVVVTRPADEDPAGLGVPVERPISQPASDVNVGIGISVGRAFLPGYGKTDEKGKVTVGIKLAGHVPAGTATVRAYAYKVQVNSPCLVVEEQGYRTIPKAFKVTSNGSR